MAWSLTNIGTTSGAVGGTSALSVTVGAGGVPAGAIIIICFGTQDGGTNAALKAAPTDSHPNTYQEVGSAPVSNGTSCSADIWYAYNVAALSNGNTISAGPTNGSSTQTVCMSVFYATGEQTTADPQDTATLHTTTGTSATPSAQLAIAPAVASSLVLGVVSAVRNPTFTQDSTNAAYATPPNNANSGGTGASDLMIAGGTVTSSSRLTYAPTLGTSRAWVEIVVAFKPSASSFVGWEAQGAAQLFLKPIARAIGGTPT